MSGIEEGASVPTILARRAAALGGVSLVALFGGAIAMATVHGLAGLVGTTLGVLSGLLALALIIAAFRERRRLIIVRHARELRELIDPVPLELVAQETGCALARVRAILADARVRGELGPSHQSEPPEELLGQRR